MPFSVGDLIDGHYRVEQRFEGGMGFVYIVLDELVGKKFAIKQLPERHASNTLLQERFRREASAWLLLDYHPHIVQAHSFHPRPEGPILILEYVDGPSLDRLLRVEKQLSQVQTLVYARQVCSGMHYAHTKQMPDRGVGILHRDIKPGNMLITRDNQVKVTDFGLAKIAGDSQITGEGQFVGTVAYSSPEQLQAAGEVSRASDVYSFGAVLYQMLSGRPPFVARSPSELYDLIQHRAPASLRRWRPKVHRGLAELVVRCLKKDPTARFSDFAALDQALAELEDDLVSEGDGACPNCGYISEHRGSRCPVCQAGVIRAWAGAAVATWSCPCGHRVAASLEFCPQCGHQQPGRPGRADRPAGPAAGTTAPKPPATSAVYADEDAPLPVPAELAAPAAAASPKPVSPAAVESRERQPAAPAAPAKPEPTPSQLWTGAGSQYYLVELGQDRQQTAWHLERAGYTVGRGSSMKIRIRDPNVARFQLFLVRLACGWVAINPDPASPVHINGIETRQRLLQPADLLRLGATWLAFTGPRPEPRPLPMMPGRWPDYAAAKSPTVRSNGSSPTEYHPAPTPAATCTLELPGGPKVVSKGQPLRIGSSPLCELRIEDQSVAPLQATVVWQSDGAHLVNLAGGLVTVVGGGQIADLLLRDGQLLQIGPTPVKVSLRGDPRGPARSLAAERTTSPPRFAITALLGPHQGQTAVLPAGQSLVLGRQHDCDLVLDQDRHVSRRHLRLTVGEADIDLKDLGSRNGFFVNQVSYNDTAVAHLGDVLNVGKSTLLIHYELPVAGQ